ncbi:MAG: PqqD family protein [Anaerolineales bacterium]|nr:PqqD family protein [Anaerolineales bacterium]
MTITLQSTVSIPEEVIFREISGEAVILNVASGKYYGLDDVGTRMWALLAEFGCLAPVSQALLEEYDAPPEQLQADLIRLVQELSAAGLLEVSSAQEEPPHDAVA